MSYLSSKDFIIKIFKIKIIFGLFLIIFQSKINADLLDELNIKYRNSGFDTTIIAIQELLKKNPTSQQTKSILQFAADIAYSNNAFDSAYQFIERYERQFRLDNFDIAYKKLTILLIQKKYNDANSLVDYMMNFLPVNYNTISSIANLLLQNGLINKALEIYQVAKNKINNPHIFMPIIINIYQAQNNYDSIIIEYTNYFANYQTYYYFGEFKQLLYETKLFKVFLDTLEKLPINTRQNLQRNQIILPILADAYFYCERYEDAVNVFLQYFKLINYNADTIKNIFEKFIISDNKKFAAELLYKMLANFPEYIEQPTYTQNIFNLYISNNSFYLHLLADNIQLFSKDIKFLKMLVSALSEYPNEYFEKIVDLIVINDYNFVLQQKLKFYYIVNNYDSDVECAQQIKIQNLNDELLFIAGLVNLYKGYFDAARIYLENIILNHGHSQYNFYAMFYYKIVVSEKNQDTIKLFAEINKKKIEELDDNFFEKIKDIDDIDIKTLICILLVNKGYKNFDDFGDFEDLENSVFKPELEYRKALHYLNIGEKSKAKKILEKIIYDYSETLFDFYSKNLLKTIF
ncbi:MAG TPA: hypothetical protein PLM75_00865 [bacterium]|nr:hypothetical protein [bacterium]